MKSITKFITLLSFLILSIEAKESEDVAVQFRQNVKTIKAIYHPTIEALREGERTNRQNIITVYRADPFLRREKTRDGHEKFVCTLTGATFGVVAHGTNDITGEDERWGHHKAMQTHVNVIKIFEQNFPDKTKLEKALKKMTPSKWATLLKEEREKYKQYSQQKTKKNLKNK